MHQADDITDAELLQRAYDAMRKPGWAPLADTLADPLRGRLVRFAAWRLLRGAPMGSLLPPVQRPVVHAPWAPPLPSHQPDPSDRKRAAAGDRDDDE